jgi:glycosyltransferase involved in cell wall biosynthesis
MRVLHVTSGNMYGGVETFLTTLARESAAVPEMDSEFVVCFEGRCSQELRALGRTPHVVGHVRVSRPHTLIRARRALAKLLAGASLDVVVCHQPWSYVVFGGVARRVGLPVVLWVHMATDGSHWLERLARSARPDLTICNSRFTAAETARWLPGVIEHVYCPVTAPRPHSRVPPGRSAVRRSLKTADQDVVIIQVSRLESWKGQHVLLDALARLRDIPAWTCWIVGGTQRQSETAYQEQLERIVEASGIANRVQFLGERRDVPELLSAADLFCQPNTSPEPFGLALVEALHAGLPVITSNIGGAREIVDASCGLLTPPGDSPAVASALEQLLADAGLRARLGDAARHRPEALCDPSRQMRRIHDVLSSVAA